ncbi:MAG TPA: MotA/TolQ/ExbB proton channel family protein [Phycisphaerae bacterium]|nr:MotA/TolQ/ExbB proton channel family protein [Phycisphaerae bacterium]HRW51612.1 MotA/TolQ/ExbB proton channel family protein [Phycisphaerae bacterium]
MKQPSRLRMMSGAAALTLLLTLSIAGRVVAQDVDAETTTKAAEKVTTTSFLDVVIQGYGWIGPIITILSIIVVYLIIEHFWTIRWARMVNDVETKATRDLIENRKFKECVERVSSSKTMFGDVLTIGLRHGRHGFEAMQEAVEERAGAWRSRLFRRVEYLNIVGNIAPLLGLLGTVAGMIEAFGEMQATQGAYGPEELAGGISVALVSTLMGLIVAIMALGLFGVCRNRVDSMTVAAHAAVIDVLEYFRPAPTPAMGGTVAPGGAVARDPMSGASAAPNRA